MEKVTIQTGHDESFIPILFESNQPLLAITYRDSETLIAEMVKGADRNGMDPLPLSDVKTRKQVQI